MHKDNAPFTVIAVWDDTGQALAERVLASNPHSAMMQVAKKHDFAAGLQIVGALYGHEAHGLITPCEESGTTAYAVDLEDCLPVVVVLAEPRPPGAAATVVKRFATLQEAQDFLATSATIDPDALAAGHYGIDAPETMVNPDEA